MGVLLFVVVSFILFYVTRKSLPYAQSPFMLTQTALHRLYRRASVLGGGSKYVVILAANQGGGVMEWKGPREWAIERDSVKNKKKYTKKWGYELEIVDMSTKKRYAHEWRESWEKVDTIRNAMRKYPHAEWYVEHRTINFPTDILQVLVAGYKHLHHGTIILSAESHLQASSGDYLP